MEALAESPTAQDGHLAPAGAAVQSDGLAETLPATFGEMALLGIIACMGGETYGYDLARRIESVHPLRSTLRLEQAMVYHSLKKLEGRGWLSMAVHPQEARPTRRTYRLTPEGAAALRRWLEAPERRRDEIRREFLARLCFTLQLDPGLAGRLAAARREANQRLAAALEAELVTLAAEKDPREAINGEVAFTQLLQEFRLAQARAEMAWLQRVADWSQRLTDSA